MLDLNPINSEIRTEIDIAVSFCVITHCDNNRIMS